MTQNPDDRQQDDGNKEKKNTSAAIRDEWHDAESVNTRATTLTRDAPGVEESALDEESTATRRSLKDSDPLEDSATENSSYSERVCSFEEALERADRAEPTLGTRATNVPQFSEEVKTHLVVTESDYVEPKTVYEAKQGDNWDQCHRAVEDEVEVIQGNETWNLVRPPTDRRHTGQMGLQSEIGTQCSR